MPAGPGPGPNLRWTPDELRELVASYFDEADAGGKPYGIEGLAYHLGTNRQTLLNYQGRAATAEIVTGAKQRIRADIENRLLSGESAPAAGIFWLKNNAGWVDKSEVDNNTNLKIQPVNSSP